MKRLIYSCYFVYLCAKLIENRQFLFGMQLFYAPDFTPPTHTLDEQESKHCIRVLRLGAGDTLYITDGRGAMHRCRIVAPDPRRCTVEVEHTDPDY